MHIVRELQLYYYYVVLVLCVTLLHITMENFTSEETKTMLTAFKELNVKPNLDSPAEFKDWMVKYLTDLTLKSDSKDKDDSDKGLQLHQLRRKETHRHTFRNFPCFQEMAVRRTLHSNYGNMRLNVW